MDTNEVYIAFLRSRISELLAQRGVSEHKLSLELGKGGSYIRAITNGLTLPSVKELFNIIAYFEISPAEFFEDWRIRLLCVPNFGKNYARWMMIA